MSLFTEFWRIWSYPVRADVCCVIFIIWTKWSCKCLIYIYIIYDMNTWCVCCDSMYMSVFHSSERIPSMKVFIVLLSLFTSWASCYGVSLASPSSGFVNRRCQMRSLMVMSSPSLTVGFSPGIPVYSNTKTTRTRTSIPTNINCISYHHVCCHHCALNTILTIWTWNNLPS